MPSIYQLKPAFQNLLRPLTRRLAGAGITANQVTLLACALSLAIGIVLSLYPACPELYWSLPGVLFARMALNAIDGMLAREHGMESRLGAILNELTDVVSDAALYLPFALLPEISPLWIVLAVLLAVISEMTGVIGVQIGAGRRYDGPLGKSDRAFLFGALAVVVALRLPLSPWVDYVVIAACALLVVTIVNRARCALLEA